MERRGAAVPRPDTSAAGAVAASLASRTRRRATRSRSVVRRRPARRPWIDAGGSGQTERYRIRQRREGFAGEDVDRARVYFAQDVAVRTGRVFRAVEKVRVPKDRQVLCGHAEDREHLIDPTAL